MTPPEATTIGTRRSRSGGPVTGAVLLGVGLGGFFDGIVLHQILQWHHMLTDAGYPASTVEGLMVNTLWDGLFHATAYLFTIAGVLVLWRKLHQAQERLPFQALSGGILVGWGIFNLVEGIIDHHLLGIHHVRPGPNQLWWDLGFLVWGAVMLLVGWRLIRAARPATAGKGISTKIIDLSARRSSRQTGAG